ncbi:unnamed protein product [Lactuca virosa]|uniref:Uncharacterized protein n=1 Tax=Lactuca virosa TaxID=75947 RepID=A0AAU9LNN9_9ASTR|nr:unnamed protein product [Lactuca virosa]
MNSDTDDKGFNDYLWSHALISDETYQKLTRDCGYNNNSNYCQSLEEELGEEIGNIDFYNIYGPTCTPLPDGIMVRKKHHRRSGGVDPCEEEYVEHYLNLAISRDRFPQLIKALYFPDFLKSIKFSDFSPSILTEDSTAVERKQDLFREFLSVAVFFASLGGFCSRLN